MKIEFEDKSYLEIKYSNSGNISLTIAAKDSSNSLRTIVNSVEISIDQFNEISTSLELKPIKKKKTSKKKKSTSKKKTKKKTRKKKVVEKKDGYK